MFPLDFIFHLMFVCNSTRENLTLALSVAAKKKTLIVPDKDADGLTSGVILLKTLMFLGLPEDMISVHLMQKGSNIHKEEERKAMEAHNPSYVFVLDQGSRKSPPVVDNADCRVLLIDHTGRRQMTISRRAQSMSRRVSRHRWLRARY